MPAVRTAYVKNIVRRGFAELVDPSPSTDDVTRLWTHFASECAYCGRGLQRALREGRVDHAIAASAGGANHISNRVLACGPCNDEEKRDLPWDLFLRAKNPEAPDYDRRRERIVAWQTANTAAASVDSVRQMAETLAAEVNALFDDRVAHLKAHLRNAL